MQGTLLKAFLINSFELFVTKKFQNFLKKMISQIQHAGGSASGFQLSLFVLRINLFKKYIKKSQESGLRSDFLFRFFVIKNQSRAPHQAQKRNSFQNRRTNNFLSMWKSQVLKKISSNFLNFFQESFPKKSNGFQIKIFS